MKICYRDGKKSNHNFMPFAHVTIPSSIWVDDEALRFYKHDNTVKSIVRRVSKQNYEKGTVIVVHNWRVGYADLVIEI